MPPLTIVSPGSRPNYSSPQLRLVASLVIASAATCLTPDTTSAADQPKAQTSAPAPASSAQSLFDGKSLTGWQVTDFAGRGGVKVESGRIVLETGVMTGVTWTNALPHMDYEISLEAMRVDGSDFFCALTFPVENDPCSFIVGGWGGGVVGLSSIDGEDAAHNETTSYLNFENGKWFKIRVRVTKTRIEAWIDADRVVNLETAGHRLSIRPEVELSKPLGIASWSTTAALRNLEIRRVSGPTPSPKAGAK